MDLQPTLIGATLTLRPLREDDYAMLYQAASDPRIWEQHPDSNRYQEEVFKERYFRGAITSGGSLVVVENETGRIVGCSRYYEWSPAKRELSIGYTFIECEQWGSGTNAEMKQLMLNHAFESVDHVWFHVGETNMRSRRAVEKLGAVLGHQEERELDGKDFIQLYYKLDASQWSA